MSAFVFDLRHSGIILETFGAGLTSHSCVLSGSSVSLFWSMWDSLSAFQSSSLSLESSKSPSQSRQCSVTQMISGALSSWCSAGWWSILLIMWTKSTWVCLAGMCFADNAGSRGNLSYNLDVPAPLYSMFDQDAFTIPSVSEMYPLVVIGLFWAQDYFLVAWTFWLPCHISKSSCTLAILCNCCLSAPQFNSNSCTLLVKSNAGSLPDTIALLAWAKYLTTAFLRNGLAFGFCMPPADNNQHTAKSSLHSTAMCCVREYIVCHIKEIGVLWVHFLLSAPPVPNIQYSKYTSNVHRICVVIITVWINLPPVLWWFRQWIQVVGSRCQWG